MAMTRKKKLSYHRAEYFVDERGSVTLGLCIKQASERLRTVQERTISRAGGQTIRLADFCVDVDGGCFLHLTVETPGEHASVVPRVTEGEVRLRVSTIPPPNDAEYMDGDAFLYVNNNHVVLCATTVRVGGVRYFLRQFFQKANARKDADQFYFMNAIDTQVLAMLHREGVREIELQASLYSASIDYRDRQQHASGVLAVISRHFKALFGSEYDVTEDALRVGVTLNVDRRRRGIHVGHKRLEMLGNCSPQAGECLRG